MEVTVKINTIHPGEKVKAAMLMANITEAAY